MRRISQSFSIIHLTMSTISWSSSCGNRCFVIVIGIVNIEPIIETKAVIAPIMFPTIPKSMQNKATIRLIPKRTNMTKINTDRLKYLSLYSLISCLLSS